MTERLHLSLLGKICRHYRATESIEFANDGRTVERISVYAYPGALGDAYAALRDAGASPQRKRDNHSFYLEIPVDRIDCRY